MSCLGRSILIVWLFAIFVIKSSYTASLTSILTVQQLSSPITGIESLMEHDGPIGYQQGSFTRDYLVQQLGIKESRLIPLKMAEDYTKALTDGPGRGGVVAVVEERAYAELFLSTRCEFSIVGPAFTRNGWGFVSIQNTQIFHLLNETQFFDMVLYDQAFLKESPLAEDMSTAILRLSENGDLKRIHDKWLLRGACSSQGAKLQEDRLRLSSFKGLFLMCGLASAVALAVYLIKMLRQFNRYDSKSEVECPRSGRLQMFLSFADEKEESVNARRVRGKMEWGSSCTSMEQGQSSS